MVGVGEAWLRSVPAVVVLVGAGVLLALLDTSGAFFAKEWAEGGRTWMGVIGAANFVVLYLVYAASLRYAELSTVTLVWIVLLQVGVMLLENMRYGVPVDPRRWVLAAVILFLVGVFMFLPDETASTDATATSDVAVEAPHVDG